MIVLNLHFSCDLDPFICVAYFDKSKYPDHCYNHNDVILFQNSLEKRLLVHHTKMSLAGSIYFKCNVKLKRDLSISSNCSE